MLGDVSVTLYWYNNKVFIPRSWAQYVHPKGTIVVILTVYPQKCSPKTTYKLDLRIVEGRRVCLVGAHTEPRSDGSKPYYYTNKVEC